MKNRPRLIAMDTMNYWISEAIEDLKFVLSMVDLLMVNDAQAREVTGEFSLVKAARKVMAMDRNSDHKERGRWRSGCFMAMKYSLRRPCHSKKCLIKLVPGIHLQADLWDMFPVQGYILSKYENSYHCSNT